MTVRKWTVKVIQVNSNLFFIKSHICFNSEFNLMQRRRKVWNSIHAKEESQHLFFTYHSTIKGTSNWKWNWKSFQKLPPFKYASVLNPSSFRHLIPSLMERKNHNFFLTYRSGIWGSKICSFVFYKTETTKSFSAFPDGNHYFLKERKYIVCSVRWRIKFHHF